MISYLLKKVDDVNFGIKISIFKYHKLKTRDICIYYEN